MIVLNASAAVELLMQSSAGVALARALRPESVVHAPDLIDLEIASVLRRKCAHRELKELRAEQMLQDFAELRLLRHRHKPYLTRIWEMRTNYTAYDPCYLALTEAIAATLLTTDGVLANARLRAGRVVVL